MDALRTLPSVDAFLQSDAGKSLSDLHGRALVVAALRAELARMRGGSAAVARLPRTSTAAATSPAHWRPKRCPACVRC